MSPENHHRQPLSSTTRKLIASLPQQSPEDLERAYTRTPALPRRLKTTRRRLNILRSLCSPSSESGIVLGTLGNTQGEQMNNEEGLLKDGLREAQGVSVATKANKETPLKTYSKKRALVAPRELHDDVGYDGPALQDGFGGSQCEVNDEGTQEDPSFKKQRPGHRSDASLEAARDDTEPPQDQSGVEPTDDDVPHTDTKSAKSKPKKSKVPREGKKRRRLPVGELVVVSQRFSGSDLDEESEILSELLDDPISQIPLEGQTPCLKNERRRWVKNVSAKYQAGSIFGSIDISEFRLPKANSISSSQNHGPRETRSWSDGFEDVEIKYINSLNLSSRSRRRRLRSTPAMVGALTLVSDRNAWEHIFEEKANRHRGKHRLRFSNPAHVQNEAGHLNEHKEGSDDFLGQQTPREFLQNTRGKSPMDVEYQKPCGEDNYRHVYSKESLCIPSGADQSTLKSSGREGLPSTISSASISSQSQSRKGRTVRFNLGGGDQEETTQRSIKSFSDIKGLMELNLSRSRTAIPKPSLKRSRKDEIEVSQRLMMVSVPRPVRRPELDDANGEESNSGGSDGTSDSSDLEDEMDGDESDESAESSDGSWELPDGTTLENMEVEEAEGYMNLQPTPGGATKEANSDVREDWSESPQEVWASNGTQEQRYICGEDKDKSDLSYAAQSLATYLAPMPPVSAIDIPNCEQAISHGGCPLSESPADVLQLVASQPIIIPATDPKNANLDLLNTKRQEKLVTTQKLQLTSLLIEAPENPIGVPTPPKKRTLNPPHTLCRRLSSEIPSLTFISSRQAPDLNMKTATVCYIRASAELGDTSNSDSSWCDEESIIYETQLGNNEFSIPESQQTYVPEICSYSTRPSQDLETSLSSIPISRVGSTQISIELQSPQTSNSSRGIPESQQSYTPDSSSYFTCASQSRTNASQPAPSSRSRSTPARFLPTSSRLATQERGSCSSGPLGPTFGPGIIPSRRHVTSLTQVPTTEQHVKPLSRPTSLSQGILPSNETRRMMTLPFAPPFKKPLSGSGGAL